MKHTWLIVALVGATACVSPEAHRQALGENAALRAQIADLAEQHQTLSARYQQLEAQNRELGARAADAAWIEEQKKRIADLLARYGEGSATAVTGVELVPTAEGYAFRVAGGVLFASGQNTLTEQGRSTLSQLAGSLAARRVRVEGHTDDQPIVRSRWGTNLRLSVERALSVADYLIEAEGLPADQVSVAGYGEHRPAVEGSSEDARQKNRRVEIRMLER